MSIDRPTVPEVMPLVRAIYAEHAAGCCLHVVLDDDNIEDEFVESCINLARENKCALCEKTAEMLLKMTETQRRRVCDLLRRDGGER